ncbi:MAG: hypothetical protein K8T10_03800 [Candidatus Eremiobacteraeota bacterium]|nr:hypothetical protein [Candidatus Eremiobacteraeota bacterium]
MSELEFNFHYLSLHHEEIVDADIEKLLTDDEDCPLGNAAYCSIEKYITLYREETVRQQIPPDVSKRLHKFIRQRCFLFEKEQTDEGSQ